MSKIRLSNYVGDVVEDSREFTLYLKLSKDDAKAYLQVTAPKTLEGSRFWLTNQQNQAKVWMQIKGGNVREVSGTQLSQHLLGSEFSMSDLIFQMIPFEQLSEPERVKRDDKVYLTSTIKLENQERLTHQVFYLDSETYLPQMIKSYQKDQLLMRLQFEEYRKIDGFYLPHTMWAENLESRRQSKLEWIERSMNLQFSDSLFDPN
jgi:hypothetical protein